MKFNHVMIVLKKELVDMFRDRKTIISSILIPILLFPIMYGFIGFSQKKITNDAEKKGVNISIITEDSTSSISDFLKNSKGLKIISVDDPDKAVEKGTVKAVVYIGKGFDEAVQKGETAPVTVQYDDSNESSMMAAQIIKGLINQYSSAIVSQRLQAKGIDPKIINPVDVKDKVTTPEGSSGVGMMIFTMLLPLMLAIYSATSVLPAATDNGAGEKERGTLEPLLTTQANRMSLLAGKYFAITVAGVIGTMSSMIGLFVAQRFNPELLGQGMSLPVWMIAVIALAAICLTLIFAALELAISVFARSFKEAQTYLSPITIIVMIPAFAVYMIDPKNIPVAFFSIPIVNLICIIKELLIGIYNPLHIIIGFGWGILYIAAATFFARYMFSRESVIFRV